MLKANFQGRVTKTEVENSGINLEREDLLIDETITLSENGTTQSGDNEESTETSIFERLEKWHETYGVQLWSDLYWGSVPLMHLIFKSSGRTCWVCTFQDDGSSCLTAGRKWFQINPCYTCNVL